jgi:hypothetical protein
MLHSIHFESKKVQIQERPVFFEYDMRNMFHHGAVKFNPLKTSNTHISQLQKGVTVIAPVTVCECTGTIFIILLTKSSSVILLSTNGESSHCNIALPKLVDPFR